LPLPTGGTTRPARARQPRWWGCGLPRAPGRPRAALPQSAAVPRRAGMTLARPGPGRLLACVQVRALARCLGRLPPAILDRRPQPRRRRDRYFVLSGGMPQDFQHLGSACRPGGNERRVRGCSGPRPIASASAAPCGVRRSPSLSVCRRSSTYRISWSCPGVAVSCSSSRTGDVPTSCGLRVALPQRCGHLAVGANAGADLHLLALFLCRSLLSSCPGAWRGTGRRLQAAAGG